MTQKIVTRFAPSPTGDMHIGGARIALYNYYYTKAYNGKCILRIEDTDAVRSSKEKTEALIKDLDWLGLEFDEKYIQSENIEKHNAVAKKLLQEGKAYRCYNPPSDRSKEIIQSRNKSPWRDATTEDIPENTPFSIRAKMPEKGLIEIVDLVFGKISVSATELEDPVLIRSDGTPTYLLAVVTDDALSGVTHVIRGDDHLTNTIIQKKLIELCNWKVPQYAHVPLILDMDGSKLSKRTGAKSLDYYRKQGILPNAMRNFLLRMGWSYGDQEIISDEIAKNFFDVRKLNTAPAKFNEERLFSINKIYMEKEDPDALMLRIKRDIKKDISDKFAQRIIKGINGLKARSSSLKELLTNAEFYNDEGKIEKDIHAIQEIEKSENRLNLIIDLFKKLPDATGAEIIDNIGQLAKDRQDSKAKFLRPLRAALTGSMQSPELKEVIDSLGITECIERLEDCIK